MNHYTYDQIEVGQKESFSVTITEENMRSFRQLTGDENPLHNDVHYANSKGYPVNVCFGMLTASYLSTVAGVYIPGERSLIHRVETDFVLPVLQGDTLLITATVHKKLDPFRAIVLHVTFTNQKGLEVCRAKMRVGVLD